MMRPRQVNKAAIAGINRVQPNHNRKVITKLLKIDQCVASLKMLVVMQRQLQDGVLQVGAKRNLFSTADNRNRTNQPPNW